MSAVCMIQQDGLEIVFVHRSFQEYFAALFVVSSYGQKSKDILKRYAIRFGDSVISMALEMDREGIQQDWVIPAIHHLKDELFSPLHKGNCALQYRRMFPAFQIHSGISDGIFVAFASVNMSIIGPIEILRKCYPGRLAGVDFPGMGIDKTSLKKIFNRVSKKNNVGNAVAIKNILFSCNKNAERVHIELNEENSWWMERVGIKSMLLKLHSGIDQILLDILEDENKKSNLLSEYFKPRNCPVKNRLLGK